LEATAAGINIPMLPDRSMWSAMIAELLAKNAAMLEREGDVGVTLLVTPGRVVPGRGKPVSSHDNTDNGKPSHCDPTVIMHVNRIDHDAINRRQTQGQPIVVTDVVQPPNESWPRHWKVRCRLHYYLADVTAKELHPNATGILRNSDKTVTESSIANIAIVESGEIFSPPRSQVLGGITQSYIEQLATEASLRWTFEPLTAERVSQADEILLMGTDGGVWWGWTLERTPATISPGPVFAQLRQAFDKLVAA
jgi:branched-chain amino acid aminotransferase